MITLKTIKFKCPHCRHEIRIAQVTSGSERIDQINQLLTRLLTERQIIDLQIEALIKAEADPEFQMDIDMLFDNLKNKETNQKETKQK